MIRTPHRGLATLSIVLGTFTSVLSSTIINVPIHDIAHDLRVSIPEATLLITTQSIAFATLLPLGGWTGSRFGRRNVFVGAVALLGAAGLVAVFGHNLTTLVAMRVLQGVAGAAIVPVVMTLLADLYEPARRAFALSAWAMANSLGQALGPPLGGVLATAFTWRSTFAPAPIIAVVTCIAALRYVPVDRARPAPLEWRGALALTIGALLIQVAFTVIPYVGAGSPFVLVPALAGIVCLIDFARTIRTAKHPFVSPQAFREPSYVMSCLGIFAATICFAVAQLAVPLYLIGVRGYPTAIAGFLLFALPLAMALFAPFTSRVVDRVGNASGLRLALVALAIGSGAIALVTATAGSVVVLAAFLLLDGAAIALTYTSSAVGSTQTEAGRDGAAIGFYNLLRIAGLSAGAAFVAIVLAHAPRAFAEIFTDSGIAVAAACAATFAINGRGRPRLPSHREDPAEARR